MKKKIAWSLLIVAVSAMAYELTGRQAWGVVFTWTVLPSLYWAACEVAGLGRR